MNEIVMGNLLAVFSTVMIIINYVVSSLTLFKISRNEKISKPLFAWIPGFNDYLLIKLGEGSVWLMILALSSLALGGPLTSYLDNMIYAQIGVVVTALWALYKILMYSRICDRYDVSVIIFAAAFIMQLVSKLAVVGLVVGVLGQIYLMKKVSSNIKPRTIVESKVIMPRLHKKDKMAKK